MDILVGSTGFVGSNLCEQHQFNTPVHSVNIVDAFGLEPELCVYAGVRAEKYLANREPEQDRAVIDNAIENIKNIMPKRLVLISTIDVFVNPYNADEDTPVTTESLPAYGANRFALEKWVRENISKHHIIRLPGLFGKNIKKNFIYDLIHVVPSILNATKYAELSAREPLIAASYAQRDDGFYCCTCEAGKRAALKEAFLRTGFSALNFTDSRGVFQFYNLAQLWEHIEIAVANNIPLLHLAVEPVSVSEVYEAVRGGVFFNEISAAPPQYNFLTKHEALFGSKRGYLFSREQVMRDIVEFVSKESGEVK